MTILGKVDFDLTDLAFIWMAISELRNVGNLCFLVLCGTVEIFLVLVVMYYFKR